MDKLITLNSFVTEVEQYARESLNYERIAQLIFAYSDFLNQPISEEMFVGHNALFPNFIKCPQKYASENRVDKSFDNFGENEFQVSIRRVVGKEYGQKDRMSLVTSYHLKIVNDLVGKFDDYDSRNEKFGWNDDVS
jgi:hypothetical protein